MSVSSLIDRFSGTEASSEQNTNTRQQEDKNTIDKTGLLPLLGPNVTSFPFSEDAYIETVKLRAEQEKTKQEYYKLELANKNINIIQMALQAKIPPHMIPLMCVGAVNEQNAEIRQEKPPAEQGRPKRQGRTPSNELMRSDAFNTNPVAPINYRFGEGSSGRRSLSPAKIGAAAVANLATPTTPYRSASMAKRVPLHQRHFSMPAEGYTNRGRYPPNDFTGNQAQSKQRGSTSSSSSLSVPQGQDNTLLKSPLGSTALLQVKPSPAQPLNKLSKLNKPPSQESMTSFQHVIQFHHWKPESPGLNPNPNLNPNSSLNPNPNPNPMQNATPTYKRHKSDSMSVDMTGLPPLNVRIEVDDTERNNSTNEQRHEIYGNEEDNDITMDTSVSEETPSKGKQQNNVGSNLNIGRYPHDILSSSK